MGSVTFLLRLHPSFGEGHDTDFKILLSFYVEKLFILENNSD